MDVWHFFLAILGQRYQRRKFWFLLAFLFKSTNGESFGFYLHFFQVYQRWKFWFLLIFLCKSQWWKFWFLLAFMFKFTNCERFGHFGHSYFYWPLWLGIPMVKVMWFGVCLWPSSVAIPKFWGPKCLILGQECTTISLLPTALRLFLWITSSSEFRICLLHFLLCFHILSL